MNKTLKYTTALGSATVALAFAVTAASASTDVVNTGNGVAVDSSTTQNTFVSISNINSAQIGQFSIGAANTGGNSTSGNIGGGSVASGAAVTSSNHEVMANQNQTGVSLPASSLSGSDVNVVNTGNGVLIGAANNQNTVLGVTNVNTFTGVQGSLGIANSGLNFTDGNIGGGNVATGAAGVQANAAIEANANQTVVNLSGAGNGGGNGTLDFVNTGNLVGVDFSNNHNTIVGVTNINQANVFQGSLGIANSGLNFTDGNIGGGSVASGTALVASDFESMANQNATGINLGNLGGPSANDAEIVNTGSLVGVDSSSTVNTVVAAVSANDSAVAQVSVEVSNSGFNFTNGNVGGGTTGSGSAGAWSGFMSGVNWNQTII